MKNEKTWPHRSETPHFSTLQFPIKNPTRIHMHTHNPTRIHDFRSSSRRNQSDHNTRDFTALPNDILIKIAANFTLPDLKTTSLVCQSWRDGLRPLREAMVFLRWGKRFKHGRGGVKVNMEKALDSFLKGAARGSTLAMVDAGLVYWEMGKKEKGVELYRKAAELGNPAAQCNLGISLLQADPPNVKEAVKWLHQAAVAGNIRGQYQLALCLYRDSETNQNLSEAARWYLRAAEGGCVRAMYYVSLCYSLGRGFSQNHKQSRKWMKLAADHGHRKAQFEHGLTLFLEEQMLKAVVYLELAERGGETAASHVKRAILHQLPQSSRERALTLADNWRAHTSSY
uniref:F-box protein At1g70590 n=1 Tax=Erigeron canadensis TaxID=72917 RepID=UPI001CB8E675|nr:F-box protein At1g70590 [Erigeron canadensis]